MGNGTSASGKLGRVTIVAAFATLAACGGSREAGGAPGPAASTSDALAVTGVTPAAVPSAGGAAVSIEGTGFGPGVRVLFGDAAAQAVTVEGSTHLVAVAPAHAAGAVDVFVQGDSGAAVLPAGLRFVDPPRLAFVDPGHLETSGGAVIIHGGGFQPGARVLFGADPSIGGAQRLAEDQLVAVAGPHAPGDVDLTVENPDGQRATLPAALRFDAPPAPAPAPPPAPAPALAAVTPSAGPETGGTVVVLSGAGLDPLVTVRLGGASATVTAASATELTLVAPPHAPGAVDVVVTNPDGQTATLAAAYTYVAPPPPGTPPVVDAVAPASGYTVGGTAVVVTGSEFANAVVWFGGLGGAAAVPSAETRTSLTVVAPPHAAGAVDVLVQNADGQTATLAGGFTYVPTPALPPPVISGLSPASGPSTGNTVVTLSGTGFVTGSTVLVGGVGAIVGGVTATTLTFTTPGGAAGAVDVTVVNPDRQTATLAGGFTYVAPPPVVTAVNVRGSPQAGGGQLLLVGSGLQDAVSVTFGGVPATGLSYDALRGALTVTVPASPSGPTADVFVDLVVTNLDGQSTTWRSFHYGNAPVPASFTPTSGRRGDPLTLTGTDFSADATGPRAGLQVSFGGTFATILSRTPTEIVVAIPKVNPGSYPIIVVNFDSQLGIAPGVFVAPGP